MISRVTCFICQPGVVLHWLFCLLCIVGLQGNAAAGARTSNPPRSFDLSFPGSVSVGQNTIYIPFQLVGRLIAVEAQIDTVQGLFFLDTGASRLLLNDKYFVGTSEVPLASGMGVTGVATEKVMGRDVDTLQWDLLIIENVFGHVVPLQHLEEKKKIRLVGVLGYSVFKEFEVLIDYSVRQLVITRLDKKGRRLDPRAIYQLPTDSISFKMQGHLIVIKGYVNGVKLKFGLDTGAELNLLDVKARRKVLENFEILRRVNMVGAGTEEVELLAGVLYDVDVGVKQDVGMRTLLTKMYKINDALDSDLDGLLGYEFLFNKRTLINYKKQKLYFFEHMKS